MLKHWRLIVASFLVALGMACFMWCMCGFPNRGGWREIPISPIPQEHHVVVTARDGDAWPMKRPSGLSIWITGEIDGEVEIWSTGWPRERLSGKVDWRVYHDYFDKRCVISYRPVTARSGHLVIRYEFH
jgi:hypothetical protein